MRFVVVIYILVGFSFELLASSEQLWVCYDVEMCVESLVKLSDGGDFKCQRLTLKNNCSNHFKNSCVHKMAELKIYYRIFNSRECEASQEIIKSLYPQ